MELLIAVFHISLGVGWLFIGALAPFILLTLFSALISCRLGGK